MHSPTTARSRRTQRIGIVNVITRRQRRCHPCRQPVSDLRSPGITLQVNTVVHRIIQTRTMGRDHHREPSGMGRRSAAVEGNLDAIRWLRRKHRLCAHRFRLFSRSKNMIPEARSTFLPLHRTGTQSRSTARSKPGMLVPTISPGANRQPACSLLARSLV